jgi:diguanylate cyclase (GGDEF)-like protein/PAS domain S-box-containing protein
MKNLQQYRSMFDYFHEGIYIVDQDRKIIYFNKEASNISGFSHEETIETLYDQNILNHIDEKGNTLKQAHQRLISSKTRRDYSDYHVYLKHKEGYRVKVHVRTIPIEENKKIVAIIEVFKETSSKNHILLDMNQDQMDVFIDPLTELFNRHFYHKNMLQIISLKIPNHVVGLLFLDIDNFKKFNDTYGHQLGDQMLRIVSKTILNSIGSSDYAIRYGGEEIIIVCTKKTREDLIKEAEKIRVMIENSVLKIDDLTLNATVSIGATIYQSKEPISSLIERADQAMYQAKKTGKNKVVFI